jgi:hypothetical protein
MQKQHLKALTVSVLYIQYQPYQEFRRYANSVAYGRWRKLLRRPNRLTLNDTPSGLDLRPTAARIKSTTMQETTIATTSR